MSEITIVEAAKQFNVTRPRIYRAIKKGELTAVLNAEGVQLVQVQDMVRLFGNTKPKAVRNAVPEPDRKLIQILEEQLKKAEEDKAFLKQQILDLRKDFDEYKFRIEHQDRFDNETGMTSHDHVQTNKTLPNEQVERTPLDSINSDKSPDQSQSEKKGLLRRLVGELLR